METKTYEFYVTLQGKGPFKTTASGRTLFEALQAAKAQYSEAKVVVPASGQPID